MATKPKAPAKPKAKGKKFAKGVSHGRPAYDPNSGASKRAASMTEDRMRPDALEFRKRFITEYLVDFHAGNAYLRAGGKNKDYRLAGYNMKREAYVCQQIQKAVDAMDAAQVTTRQRVLAGLVKEANHDGLGSQHSARVTAWQGLAKILHMGEKEVERTMSARGGVMVVPETSDLGSWEQRAAAAQDALKKAVRE